MLHFYLYIWINNEPFILLLKKIINNVKIKNHLESYTLKLSGKKHYKFHYTNENF